MAIRKLMLLIGMTLLATMLLSNSAAFAQPGDEPTTTGDTAATDETAAEDSGQWVLIGDQGLKLVGIGVGLGLVIMGGGRGIGNIGSSAVEAMARQPEAANDIRGLGILLSAFIEGGMLFGAAALFLAVFI